MTHQKLRRFVVILAACLAANLFPLFTGAPALALAQPLSCGKWNVVKSPNPTTQWNELLGIAAITASDAWVVGYAYPDQSAPLQTVAEHWDGSQWTDIASPNVGNDGSELEGVAAISATDVWAVGAYYTYGVNDFSTLIEHWDGTQWSVIPSPNPGANDYLSAVAALATNNVWAVGSITSPNIVPPLIEHWDGTSWSVVSTPGSGALTGITALSPTNIWAVGYANGTLTMHWDGTSWSIIPSPSKGIDRNFLYGIAGDPSTGNAWSVGTYRNNGHYRTLIEFWNGKKWKVVASPDIGPFDNTLYSVVEVAGNDIWAVGYHNSQKIPTDSLSLIEHWDGTKWRVVNSPNIGRQFSQHNDFLNSVTQVPGTTQVWAAGYYQTPPPYANTLTEFYC